MPLTLAEADKYSTNQVLIGVAETAADTNPLLALMPFVSVLGNATQYQRKNVPSPPTFIAPGGTVTEGVPTTSQVTIALKILIGDADIDKFLRITRSKDQDLAGELLAMKAKDFADTWGDKVVYGSIDADPDEFDGMHEIISDDVVAQQIHAGAGTTPGAGSFDSLDEMIDLVRPRPDALLASRRSIRGIQALARSQGWDLALSTPGGINRPVTMYHDLPLLPADFQVDTETLVAGAFGVKTGGTASSIFAVRLDETGLFGISASDPNVDDELERIIQVENIGTLETKDANRWRVKHYGALALKDSQALARYDGISAAAWTNV